MRLRKALYAMPLVLMACAQDTTGPQDRIKPAFDHGTDVSIGSIHANNYHLEVSGTGMHSTWAGQEMLFAGNLAYGNSANSSFYVNPANGESDFFGIGLPIEINASPDASTPATSSTLFVERPVHRLGVKTKLGIFTVRETFAYTDAANDDYLIMRYTLTNPTDVAVSGLYTGVQLDPDVVIANRNIASFDAAQGAAKITVTTSPIRHAVVLLNHPVNGYRHFVNGTDPTTNQGFFDVISGGIMTGTSNVTDVRQYIGAAPVTLQPGESQVVSFAFVAGGTDAELNANIAAAKGKAAALTGSRPVTAVAVAIHPGTVVFSASITFPSAATAAKFVNSETVCGSAPIRNSAVTGARVDVTFDALDVDDELRTGDAFHCAGRLSDGNYFAGYDTPELAVELTPVQSLTPTVAGNELTPTFSPDGGTIVYSTSGPVAGGAGLFLMSVDQGENSIVRLTTGPDSQPTWSPDGSTIVFSRGSTGGLSAGTFVPGGLFSVNVASKALTRLTSSTAVLNGTATVITRTDAEPDYSPDGSKIVFRSGRATNLPNGGTHLWMMTPAGEVTGPAAVPFVMSGVSDFSPRWSPDGTKVFYISTESPTLPNPAIYSIGVAAGSTRVRITDEEVGYAKPAISPDGKTLAAISVNKLLLIDLQSGLHTVPLLDPRPLVFASGVSTQNIEFTADGTRILFGADNQIWLTEPRHIVTPVERALALENSIESLLEDGLISASDASGLQDKLGQVAELVERGNVNTALNNLNAFLNKVEAMTKSRRINQITSEQIVANTNALVDQLTTP